MCDPTAMAVAFGAQAFMQYQQGQAQAAAIKMEGENNRRIAEFNAQQQEVAATETIRKGAQDAGVIRQNVRKANATATARLSSAGLDADVGTPATLLNQNVQTGEANAMSAMRDAQLEAMGYNNNAMSQRFQGDIGVQNASMAARNAKQKGLFDAAGTLVSGTAWYGGQQGWWSK